MRMNYYPCSIEGCEKPRKSYGLCSMHASRKERHGDPSVAMRDLHSTPAEGFMRYVDRTDTCWLWTGAIKDNGYGDYSRGGHKYAHRFSYELHIGPIPDGLVIDHLCRVKACVNPAHLEAVTQHDNVMRGLGPASLNARKTRCPEGHEFTPENTRLYHDGKWRACHTCEVNRRRARYLRDRAA